MKTISDPNIKVIIPAYNEEEPIGMVLNDIPKDLVSEVIVVDNGSTDFTVEIANKFGATVLHEPKRGYGYACQCGIDYLKEKEAIDRPDIVVFLDADYSDFPEEMYHLVKPIIHDMSDLMIGSRIIGHQIKGALPVHQRIGNWLATKLIWLFHHIRFTDIGPFRAIRYEYIAKMQLKEKTYGWTIEMQLKAAKMNIRCGEVPVKYRPRVGQSKVSGTFKGSIGAGISIFSTIFKYV
ncbi:MAG: glycosyltransferase family 2 protein [Cyclobacteriaceae bacterium]